MQNAYPILWPVIAMVFVTFCTWIRLYFERIGEMKRRRIAPQEIATRHASSTVLESTRAADHLANLFEMPVLFYVLCLALILTRNASHLFVLLAWGYVVLRAIHAVIHMTYNRVLHRFYAYVASSALLFAMWAMFALALLDAPAG